MQLRRLRDGGDVPYLTQQQLAVTPLHLGRCGLANNHTMHSDPTDRDFLNEKVNSVSEVKSPNWGKIISSKNKWGFYIEKQLKVHFCHWSMQ